jgi:hypothetical protein
MAVIIKVKVCPNYLPHVDAYRACTDNEASLAIEQVCAALKYGGGYDDPVEHVKQFFDEVTYQGHNTGRHPVTFRRFTRAPLRLLAEHSQVEIEGLAQVNGYAVNETPAPSGIVSIAGHKLKVVGDNPDIGIYFVSASNATKRVTVAGCLAENTGSKLIGIIPSLSAGTGKGGSKTHYPVGGAFLKEPRVFSLTAA